MTFNEPAVFSPSISLYMASRGTDNVINALRADCQELVADQSDFPINLESLNIVRRQNVSAVRRIPLAIDGRVYASSAGRGFIVEVNSNAVISRQNFTLGHEIGHTFFMPFRTDSSNRNHEVEERTNPSRDPFEEYLCNLVSAELLMPQNLFLRQMGQDGLDLSHILAWRTKFNVSLLAIAKRAAELSPWNFVLTSWIVDEASETGFSVEWSVRSKNACLFMMRGMTGRNVDFLKNALNERNFVDGDVDLGLMASLKKPVHEPYFTQAFQYSHGRLPRIATITILENSPRLLLQQIASRRKRNADLYKRLLERESSQTRLKSVMNELVVDEGSSHDLKEEKWRQNTLF